MNRYDYYAVSGQSLSRAASLLSEALGVPFSKHENDGEGEYYLAQLTPLSNFKLTLNSFGNTFREPGFEKYPYILQSNRVADADAVRAKLREIAQGIIFIRRAEVEAREYVRNYLEINGKLELVSEKALR